MFSEYTALGRDAPRGWETKTRDVDLGRERVEEGGGVEITHGVFKFQVCIRN